MLIVLSPQRRDDALSLSVDGETLVLNGERVNLSILLPVTEDGQAFIHALIPKAQKVEGQLRVTVILPCSIDASPARLYPSPIEAEDGPVSLPE